MPKESTMKKKFAYTLVTSLGAASTQADVPVYRDQTLTLQEILVIKDAGPRYYRNVRMAANPDGSFAIVGAERRTLALVHDINFIMLPGLPLELSVEIRGDMTQSCLALEAPLVSRKGFEFTVAVAETPYDANIQCFNPATGFVINVPLDVEGLPPGEYLVAVNGFEERFTLGAERLPQF
jgi:hypothetical protein